MTQEQAHRRRALRQALKTKRDAEQLLDDLLVARRDTLAQLRERGRVDALAQVTGRTAFDHAIERTRQLLDSLNASLERTRKQLATQRALDAHPPVSEPCVDDRQRAPDVVALGAD
ncbi:MAG: hypothetical protein D6824_07010 [Planctomycetota bacterium]|nr:MAG: hypothetical protein D6824_07010 [Planctomycetota bacterium]